MKNEVTITISLDIENMCPSITFNMVKKAINFYAKYLKSEQKDTITECLKMIEFGMGNTLLTFIDQYYEYGGSLEAKDRGLTIGGYESAWLAHIVASYNLDNTEDLFENTSKHHGIYRNDDVAFLIIIAP